MCKLKLRRGARSLVAALRHATVAVDVVALVLLVKQARQLVHLHDLLEKVDLPGLERRAVGVHEFATHLGAVLVRCAAELLALVHGKVGVAAHDRAHLDGAVLPLTVGVLDLHERRERLASHVVCPLEDAVVVIAVLLEVHGQRKSRRATTNNADAGVLVHSTHLSK